MNRFIFDLQRFDTVAINASESQTIDGVTYTAISDAVLNRDDDNKVSGLASGSVTAVVSGAENSPTITFDATDGAIDFTCTQDDGALKVRYQNHSLSYTSGSVTYSNKRITFPKGNVGLTGTLGKIIPFNINVAVPESDLTGIFDGDKFNLASTNTVTVAMTFPEEIKSMVESEAFKGNIKGLVIAILNLSEDSFEKLYDVTKQLITSPTTLNLSGEFTYDRTDKSFSFAQDSKLDISVLNYVINLAAVDGVLDGFSVYNEKTDDSISIGAKISPSSGNGKLDFTLSENGKTLFKDVLKINSGLLTIDLTNAKLSLDANSSLTMTVRELYTATIASTDAISATFSADANGNIVLTPDGKVFKVTLQRDSATVFDGTIQLSNGSLLFNQETHSITLTQGTTMTFTQNNNSISLKAKDAAGAQIVANENGIYTITPGENGGSVDVEIKQNGETIFQNSLSVKGSISFNPTNRLFTLTDGTTVTFSFNDYTLTATADGNTSGTVSLSPSGNSITSDNKDGVNLNIVETTNSNDSITDSLASRGISITPDTEDEGKLYLTLTSTSGDSLSAEIELLSGSFILGEDGTLSVTKGTELQIKFSDDYIVNFKAIDDAGGVISLGSDGITFTPGSDDGGLELSVTRDGETRSASLDVTGSVTYKLDGSISLAQGTVVRNVFEDGNILTITANTDASGSITFNPQTGLTIKPTTPDALTVSLQTGGDLEIVNITSITGSITYSGGVVTASDGTEAQLSFFGTWEPKLYTTGGTASIQFTADRTIYTANEGATLVLDGNNDLRIEFENGSITDVYAENIGNGVLRISEGATLRSNDYDFVFTLEKAGNYTLNGMDITTTKDNVEVMLSDYDTITLDGVSYTKLDDDVQLTFDDAGKVSGIASGKVQATVAGAQNSPVVTFDATDSAINFTATSDGEIITVTAPIPIEFTKGEFTYKGNTVDISAGSIIAIVSERDGYILRNEIFYEYGTGGTYTFNDTAFTAEGGRTRVLYTFTNGDNTRTLQMEGYGKTVTNYAEQGFTLLKGSSNSITIGGYTLTATAVEDAGVNIYLSAKGLGLIPNKNDGSLNVALTRNGTEIFAGDLQCTSGSITLGYDHAVTLAENTSFNFTWNDYVTSITTTAEATTDIALTDTGISFTPHDGDGALNFLITKSGTPIFGGALNVTGGTISFDSTTQKISFTEGTKIQLGIGNQELGIEVVGGNASIKVEADGNGNFTITPDENDGSLDVTFKRDGEITFQNNLSVTGSMIFNPLTNLLTLKDGTIVSLAFKDYTLTATAQGDAASTISMSADGIFITPQKGDGTLNLTLTGTSSGSLSANIEVLSGGFLFGLDGALTVTEGTELKIDFGDGYIINFKATDAAGGAISLGSDGLTFAPGSEDGGLQLSITRDGETRSASLDVTGGSVTYKLDGSISLTKGTVVKNVFDSGNILTITANTDASGSIIFNPQTGLTIAPTTADALNVVLTKGNLDTVISSINGIINYRGGIVTASDGTTANMRVYDTWEIKFSTEGGTASIQFTDDRTIYTAGEGATFTVDYLNGMTTAIQNGSYANVYDENIEDYVELVSEGTILRSNDAEVVFTLEKAGNYTLNGMKVTTTKDNVEVMLPDYNTVQFEAGAGITFNGQEFSGDNIITLNDGNIIIENTEDNATVTGTALADSISNSGEGVTITALAGNDTITNTGASAIINGGAGDDLIQIDGDDVTIEYSAGNDTITGFDETSTLSIGDNVYSTQQSGDDLIITVGESKITLVGAASLSAPNIESTNPAVELIETILKRTALGYPVMAAIAFHPEEYHGDEPTNYSNKEDWTITSADNLELHAVHYTPENSNDKWAVIVHGYGHNHKHMYPFAGFYLANGYNVLMVDQRTAGDSEGTWLTMGAAEGADVALWTQEIARRNSNAKITLHGVSMGSATAMLAAARSDAVNVTSLIEDCGYTSAMDVFYLLNEVIVKAPTEVIAALDLVAEGMTGYYLHDAAPISSISSAKMPTLFISGDSDSVVPISMLASLYEASGAEVKEKFLVEGVGHGRAGLEDPIGYSNAVFRFVAEANGEGWETENVFDDISLRGTKYNDTIANSGDGVTINTGEGDDIIQLDGDNVRIEYSDGNDTINGFNESTALKISGEYATATSGDDVVVTVGENAITLTDAASLDTLNISGDTPGQIINNTVDNTLVSGSNDNDSIFNIGDNVTIQAQGGDDSITNYGANAIVDGGLDNDIIKNSYVATNNSTIIGGDGNDSISNSESNNVSISAGAGNDTILNEHAYYPTIEGGDGNDSIIIRQGNQTYIDGGAGNDTILGETTSSGWAMGGYATINGGAGDDYINPVFSDSASIFGGEGKDTIITSGNDSTLNGGEGDDIISLYGASVDNNIIEYETGSGNDIIYGLNATGTISLTSGEEYSTVQSGDDVILTVGENTITVAGASSVNVVNYELTGSEIENTISNTLVSGTRFDDTINNEGSNVTINASAGNDVIQNHGANSSVNGGAGTDSITNMGANNSTIEGDYGDDVILNNSDNVLINGSYGNDTLSNSGANVTIASGSGNDYIYNGGANAVIEYSGGMDTVVGFNETSTLSAGSDFSKDDVIEGTKDVIVFRDNYFVTLEDLMLTTDSINVNGEAIALSKTISLSSGGDSVTVSRSNVSVIGNDGNDSIENEGSNVIINSGEGNDSIKNYGSEVTINAAADDDFIQNTSASSSILGDTGNDTIVSRGHYNYIDGGEGADNIFVTWDTANYDKNASLPSDPIEDALNSMTLEEKIGQMMMVGVYSPVINGQIKSLLNDSLIGGVILFDNSMESVEQTKKLNDDMQAFSSQKAPLLIAVDEEGGIVARGKSFLEPAPSQESIGQTGDPDNANYWAKYNAGLLKSIDANLNFAPVADVGTTDTRSFSDDTDTVTQFVEAAAQGYEEENFLYTLKHFPGIGKSTVDTHDNISHVSASKEVLEEEDIPPFKKIIDDHDNSKFAVMVGHVIYDALDSVNAASFSPAVINNLLREELGYSGVVVTDDVEMGAIRNIISLEEVASGVIQAGGDIALDTSSNPKEVREALLNAVEQGEISEERIDESVRRILNLKANLDAGSYATVNGGDGNDFIKADYYTKYSSIAGGAGSDTIANSGDNNTIDGGDGENLIILGDNTKNNIIVLSGNTTVENFKTGFGDGSDTIYINGDPAGVEFKDGGITFGNSTDSLTFSDITTTEKINIYHERRQVLNKGVFIAGDDWYSVESSDLSVGSGEEVYFVGSTSTANHGVDFGGISSALNVTMDTAYEDSEYFVPGTTTWINSVYSLKGGAGNTTITGSDKSDTIIAGTGATTINAAAGDDVISLGSASALVQYSSGDGADTISGFNSNSTLQIGDGTATYTTRRIDGDVIVGVGDDSITLAGGATLETVNIIGEIINEDSAEIIKQSLGADSIQTVTSNTYKVDNDEGNNFVYVDKTARGSKEITLGKGGDAVFVEASKGANVTVTGGAGNDSLFSGGTAPITFDMSKGGADKIYARFNGENISLKGYKASNGGGIATSELSTQDIVADIIENGGVTFSDDAIKINDDEGTSGKYSFAGNVINLFDATGEKQAIGFTNSDGGKLDVSKESDNYLLVGNYLDNKNGGSTLIGGKGNDTLLGGEGDVLNAGGGNDNRIILQDNDKRGGADIILNSGKTTVQNFKAGFDDGDRIFGGVDDFINFKFDGTNVSVQTNDAWHGVLSDVGNSANFVNILAADANGTIKIAVAQENAVIAVDDEIADYYIGENSAIDFTNYEGSLMANLGSEETSLGTGEVLFSGINQLTAGSGQTTLMGSARNETLYAGTGTASLYGGGGKNYLANTADERDGATTFFVLGNADGARNTISSFAFVTADGVADKIEIDTNTNVVSDVRTNGNDVVIEVSNRKGTATERAVIQGAVGQNMQFGNNVVAQVNKTALTYDGTANFFVATEKNAGISVGADVSGKAAIWLGKENFVGDIRTIDATASSVKAELAGNDTDNIISAGNGDSSLWGGNGGDDILTGGAGKNSFFYTNGNGSDTIGGANAGDLVYLSEITLDQIASTSVENNVATINFKDGGKLTVNDAANCNYVLTQGDQAQIYKVNESGFVNA